MNAMVQPLGERTMSPLAQQHPAPPEAVMAVRDYGGFRYRAPASDSWRSALESGLIAFVPTKEEQTPGGPLVHGGPHSLGPRQMLGKTLSTWATKRQAEGYGLVVIPPSGWQPGQSLMHAAGTIRVLATKQLPAAMAIAGVDTSGDGFVLTEPAGGWRVDGSQAGSKLPWGAIALVAVGLVGATAAVYYYQQRQEP